MHFKGLWRRADHRIPGPHRFGQFGAPLRNTKYGIGKTPRRTQKATMAWDWLSPIPGTLNNSKYRLKRGGICPSGGIGDEPPESASLPHRHSNCNVARLDIIARLARDKVKERELDGIFDIFRCFEIARIIDVRQALLQVRACRANGGGG